MYKHIILNYPKLEKISVAIGNNVSQLLTSLQLSAAVFFKKFISNLLLSMIAELQLGEELPSLNEVLGDARISFVLRNLAFGTTYGTCLL